MSTHVDNCLYILLTMCGQNTYVQLFSTENNLQRFIKNYKIMKYSFKKYCGSVHYLIIQQNKNYDNIIYVYTT